MRLFEDSLWLLSSSFDQAMQRYPAVVALLGWVVGVLSYHQDVKLKSGFGLLSQLFAVICLIALVVFGFTHGEWWNFLIVSALAWLHIQFTRRWSARPGAWW